MIAFNPSDNTYVNFFEITVPICMELILVGCYLFIITLSRAQQASDRWQARYTEKCQEVKKLEANLSLAKSTVARLEKEKRVLLARLADAKGIYD